MKRSIMFWVYFAVAIVLGIYFATRIVMIQIGNGKLANIHNISLVANPHDHDLSAVETVAKSALHAPMRALDLTVLNNRILAVPGVRNVATRRMPNGALRIRIEMHKTVALWTDGVAYYPLAADGTTVDIPSDVRNEGALVFRGMLPDDISEITRVTRPIATLIDYIEWIENRRWNIVTTDGITVMLPEDDFDTPENEYILAIHELISLNDNKNILGRDIKTIDMRNTSRILVK